MTKRYQYKSLQDEKKTFRLIKLLPGHSHEELKCELESFHIKEHGRPTNYPNYGAISYVWGEEKDRTTIRCHNDEVEIPKNLEGALKRLRDKSKPKYLWTDSICINQADEAEKDDQIQVMGSIYRDARVVYVWLGEEKETEAFELMEYLSNYLSLGDGEFKEKAHTGTEVQWQSLSRVLGLSWFKRVWTLQEICLAAHATVLCGPSQIEWPSFLALCKRLHTTGRLLRVDYDLRFHRVLRTAIDFQHGNERPGFILKLLRTRKCANDIDRIRGIIDHAFFQRFRDKHHRDFIPLTDLRSEDMDFAISTELLRLPEPLYTLSLVQHDAKTMATYAHPSWVPRFRQGTFLSTFADETKRPGSWNAGGGEDIGSHIPIRNVLRVQGVELDCIEWQSSNITNILMNRDEGQIIKGIWQQVQGAASSVSMNGNQTKEKMEEKSLRDFCRVFYFDNHFAGREGTPSPYPSVEKQMAHCLAYFVDNGIELSSSLKQLRMSFGRNQIQGDAKEFFLDVLHHCRNRRFIITSKGHLGLAPEITHMGKNGDKVCILFGSQVPFVLRPVNAEYRLCGECFLLGMMNGEAIKSGAFKPKPFTLV